MQACAEAKFNVAELMELYNPDEERVELAKRRQAAVWRGEKPDLPPVVIGGPLSKEQERIPNPNCEEAFHDAGLMLCSQMRGACSAANSGSDAVPSIRVNFGTGILLACFGLEQEVFPDKMPWLREHLDKARISKLTPDDIKIRGSFAKALEYIRFFKATVGDMVPIYCLDTQGPFDLAHLLMGDDLFMEIYDDPKFVHHLMELCLELGIRAHSWAKEAAGEALYKHWHGNQLYAENMGIRICEDTTAIVSPDTIAEFAMPYSRRLAQHFGGAWIHYCGRNDHLTKAVCEMPEVRGINFGFVPGHEQDHQFEQDMELIQGHGKVYFGSWPRRPGEGGAAYLRRMRKWAKEGSLILCSGPQTDKDGGFKSLSDTLDFWYSL